MTLSIPTVAPASPLGGGVARLAGGRESPDEPANKGFDDLLHEDSAKGVSRQGLHTAEPGEADDADKPSPVASEDPADPASQDDREPVSGETRDQAANAGNDLPPGGTHLPLAVQSTASPPVAVAGGDPPSPGQASGATQAGALATAPGSVPANPLPAVVNQAHLAAEAGHAGQHATKTGLTGAHSAKSPVAGAERQALLQVAGLEGPQGAQPMNTVPAPAASAAGPAPSTTGEPGQSQVLPGGALDVGHGDQGSAARQLGERLLWMVGNEVQSARVRITPPHLGSLELQLSLQHNQASVTLLAHNAALRDLVQAAIPRLAEQFAANGLVLADAQVTADPAGQGGTGTAGNGGMGQPGSQGPATSAAGAVSSIETGIAAGAMRLPAHAGVLSTFV